MFTLKIKWMRFEAGRVVDETTLFIPADRIAVHGEILDMEKMQAWEAGSFMDYSIENDNLGISEGKPSIMPSRLIEVTKDDRSTWYLATQAWVLGTTGSTIERVAP